MPEPAVTRRAYFRTTSEHDERASMVKRDELETRQMVSEPQIDSVARTCQRWAGIVASTLLFVFQVVGASTSPAQELYYAEGYTISDSTDGFGTPTFAGVNQQVLEAVLCPEPGSGIEPGEKLFVLADTVRQATGIPFPQIQPETFTQYKDFAQDFCEPDSDVVRKPFNILYATCRMTMRTESEILDVRFPRGATEGSMEIIDHQRQEVLIHPIVFTRILNDQDGLLSLGSEGAGDNVTRQDSSDFDAVLSETLHAVTYEFSFKLDFLSRAGSGSGTPGSSGETGIGGFAGLMSQLSPTIATQGIAWVSPEAPGVDIVRAFYERFAGAVRSGPGAQSLLGGLFNHQILSEGIPAVLTEITEIRMPHGVQERTVSSTRIFRHFTLPEPEGYCEDSLIPDGYAISNPTADAASAAAGGAPGNAGSGSGAGPAASSEAMNGVAEAMRGLSAERRSALEGFGLGQLLGGGVGAGDQPQDRASAPNDARSAGTGPSSADLYSDDMTQLVQRHLNVLGYDPGNTDGEPSVQTTIAISQFQAERGLEVTGEVSPQLAGVLAAEVDQRR